MSKESLMRFMMLTEIHEELKKEYEGIMTKQDKINSEEDWNRVIQEELIPLGKTYSFEFSLEDIKELGKPSFKELSDDELEHISGGRGQYSLSRSVYNPLSFRKEIRTYNYSCTFAPDDETFIARSNSFPNDCGCPDYVYSGYGPRIRYCGSCSHNQSTMTVS